MKILLFYDEPLVYVPSSPSFCLLFLYCCYYMTRWRFKSGKWGGGCKADYSNFAFSFFLFASGATHLSLPQKKKEKPPKRTTI